MQFYFCVRPFLFIQIKIFNYSWNFLLLFFIFWFVSFIRIPGLRFNRLPNHELIRVYKLLMCYSSFCMLKERKTKCITILHESLRWIINSYVTTSKIGEGFNVRLCFFFIYVHRFLRPYYTFLVVMWSHCSVQLVYSLKWVFNWIIYFYPTNIITRKFLRMYGCLFVTISSKRSWMDFHETLQ